MVAIRLTPGASHNSIGGIYQDANGDEYLKVSVTAIAEDSKANKALVNLLAKQLKIPKSKIIIVQGHTHRNKIIILDNLDLNPEDLFRQFIPNQLD